jgi:hypothetical protein
MPKKSRFIPFVCAAVLAGGCSGPATSADQTPPTASPSGTASSARHSAIRILPPVAKVTSACALLSASELRTLLGGRTKVTATELKPDRSGRDPFYTCKYGRQGKYPFDLAVLGLTQKGLTPQDATRAAAKASGVRTHNVAGVGDSAVYYTLNDGNSVLSADKLSQGEVRSADFVAPKIVPERKFIEVVKLVMSRM